ncbi:MAG: aspartate aminotransferase family protein [Leptospirales bacterium]
MGDNNIINESDEENPFLIEEEILNEQEALEKQTDEPEEATISYDPAKLLTLEEVQELDKKYILHTYDRMPVHFAYGSGEFLYDSEGKEYIDFLSGIAVTGLGHAHADLVEALAHQADLLWHSSNLFHNQQQAQLARALVEINFPGKVFFSNSGTEANEAAIKMLRAWGEQNSPTGSSEKPPKNTIIALKGSFHGRTFGAMSVTGQQKVQDGFGNLLSEIRFVEPNDIEELEDAVDDSLCGIILEPILGEGGVLPLELDFFQKARDLCDQYKGLLVADEIQTGMGRTGTYFAWQRYEIQPDILTIAKGLGSGFPIGAVLVADQYSNVLQVGSHGSTFGGNHLATAVGYEVIRLMETNKVLENVNDMHDYMMVLLNNLLNGYPDKIKEIRGAGLLIGIVLNEDIAARPLIKKALEKRFIIGRAGDNVIRLAPPLIVRPATIDRAMERLEELIREI